MTYRISKIVLTSHITFSVGWLGAVAVFVALAIAGLTTMNSQITHSTYVVMKISTWFVIVPFCLASFLTGLIQALGTKWGLFKHYWIIVKLFLTFVMTVLLLLHLQPISYLAGVATDTSVIKTDESVLLIDLLKKGVLAILVLIFTTTISIYKPWGKIQFKQGGSEQQHLREKKKPFSFYLLIGLVSLIIIFIIIHLLGGGMSGH